MVVPRNNASFFSSAGGQASTGTSGSPDVRKVEAIYTQFDKTVHPLRTMASRGGSPVTQQALEILKPVDDAIASDREKRCSARDLKNLLPQQPKREALETAEDASHLTQPK